MMSPVTAHIQNMGNSLLILLSRHHNRIETTSNGENLFLFFVLYNTHSGRCGEQLATWNYSSSMMLLNRAREDEEEGNERTWNLTFSIHKNVSAS